MFYTNQPTQDQVFAFKGNRGKTPEQIIFQNREEALSYVEKAKAFLATLEVNHRNGKDVPLIDNLFIRTYRVPIKRRKAISKNPSKRFMILGAHFDDEVVGPSGLVCKAVDAGHEVYVLTFCGGSSGRADHWLTEQECYIVRLYETIQGAMKIGILEIHIIVDQNGLGLKEWFWGGDMAWIREIAVRLARMYNVDYVVAHHLDSRVDFHPDHPPVGLIALTWTKQGQWTDHHGFYIPDCRIIAGEEIRSPQLWLYVVWAGEINPQCNLYIEFDLRTARRIAQAIGSHWTQTVPVKKGPFGISNSYALMSLMPKLATAFARGVNDPRIRFEEGIVMVENPKTITSFKDILS